MRYLFRLEGPKNGEPCYETGRNMAGAYMAGFTYLQGIQGDYYERTTHPCPNDLDVEIRGKKVPLRDVMSTHEYFAFANLEDCRRWWYHREDLALAQDAGFRLVLIPREDVGDIRELRRQLTYRPKPWGRGDCPVIRRYYAPATSIHELSQEDLESWADGLREDICLAA